MIKQTEHMNKTAEHKETYREVAREAMVAFPDRRKYLVVEDDFTLQSIWEHIIQSVDSHAIIRWARSEEGAEKLINDREKIEDPFDFVIVDIMLVGEKTGIDLWQKYKNNGLVFLFASALSERKFSQMIGEDKDNFPIRLRKPLYIPDCVHTLKTLIS